MLPRQNRLKEKVDFDNIFKKGKKVSTPLFLLAYINRNDEKPSRVGVVASKKVGGAVQRNRSKRIIREASLELIQKFPKAYDFCFISNTATSKSTTKEISDLICNLPNLLHKYM